MLLAVPRLQQVFPCGCVRTVCEHSSSMFSLGFPLWSLGLWKNLRQLVDRTLKTQTFGVRSLQLSWVRVRGKGGSHFYSRLTGVGLSLGAAS